jgi:ribonuclease P protein component
LNATDHSFGKQHRLCGKKPIDRLFAEGVSFFAWPFRCIWLIAEADTLRAAAPVQVLITVGKKNHKRAVARNRIKRRTREACRLNRYRWDTLPLPEGKRLLVGFVYGSKEILDYSTIEHGVIRAITELRKQLAAGCDLPLRSAD